MMNLEGTKMENHESEEDLLRLITTIDFIWQQGN